jgi:hypothetical protein
MPFLSHFHWQEESAVPADSVFEPLAETMEDVLGPATPRTEKPGVPKSHAGLFQDCANPGCRAGWLRVWRNRSAPIFEGGWSCCSECTVARMETAVRREFETAGRTEEVYRHRIPLGLTMLEQGWITRNQLRSALEAQRAAGGGRIGHWLVRHEGVSEHMVTRALGLQWSCPVLPLELHDAEGLTPVLPRLFIDAFGALPLRIAAGRILYLGFEDRPDPVLALVIERMSGLRVESGLVQESQFRPAHERMLEAKYPVTELLESASEPVLAKILARRLEAAKPVESRLVRVHDCLWLRMWMRPQTGSVPELASVRDMICSLRPQ